MSNASRYSFRTTIQTAGKTATGIAIPPDVIAALGTSKRPAVKVTMNNQTYRSTVAVMGGQFMVSVSAQHRELTGVAGGDEVDVTLELDTESRYVVLPKDFADALQDAPVAKEFFATLSTSNKGWHITSIEGAKTPETRARRLAKSIELLRTGNAR